uniref:Uncharacterized protein n=1 Tax=Caenorhabditis japonica TaxID=281687 RepID=A0A8R1ITX1_CAEJA
MLNNRKSSGAHNLAHEDSREMSSRPKRLRLSCRKVCELWFPDDETSSDESDGIGDDPMVNEESGND